MQRSHITTTVTTGTLSDAYDKGVFTIEKCHLHRVELAEERADQKMYMENKGSIIAELVHLATISNHYIDNQDDFLQYVKDVVEEYNLEQMKDNV